MRDLCRGVVVAVEIVTAETVEIVTAEAEAVEIGTVVVEDAEVVDMAVETLVSNAESLDIWLGIVEVAVAGDMVVVVMEAEAVVKSVVKMGILLVNVRPVATVDRRCGHRRLIVDESMPEPAFRFLYNDFVLTFVFGV
ncbi:hypothetical protein R6Q59_005917 [Mikania micrantha]